MSDRTETRFRGITVEGGPAPWDVLARPTSLHGAAVRIRLMTVSWESRGYVGFRGCVDGTPITDEQRSMVPELDDFLV